MTPPKNHGRAARRRPRPGWGLFATLRAGEGVGVGRGRPLLAGASRRWTAAAGGSRQREAGCEAESLAGPGRPVTTRSRHATGRSPAGGRPRWAASRVSTPWPPSPATRPSSRGGDPRLDRGAGDAEGAHAVTEDGPQGFARSGAAFAPALGAGWRRPSAGHRLLAEIASRPCGSPTPRPPQHHSEADLG